MHVPPIDTLSPYSDKPMTAREAAEFLGSNYWSVIALARRHLLPHYRIGRKILFRREALTQWIQAEEARNTQNVNTISQREEIAARA